MHFNDLPCVYFLSAQCVDLYLMNLMEAPSTAANVEHYARLVRETAEARRVSADACEVQSLCQTTTGRKQLAESNGRFNFSQRIEACEFFPAFNARTVEELDGGALLGTIRAIGFGVGQRPATRSVLSLGLPQVSFAQQFRSTKISGFVPIANQLGSLRNRFDGVLNIGISSRDA